MTPNYISLEQNICDGIKEGQIKLGFDNETVRLYYPLSSIAAILAIDITSTQEMMTLLQGFKQHLSGKLGELEVSHNGDRFCFAIPPKGTQYIHEHYETSEFLVTLINKVREPLCKLEDVLAIFHHYSKNIVCQKGNHIDFDYVIFFEDGMPDAYYYCFKFDDFHATYHRFTKFDFEEAVAE